MEVNFLNQNPCLLSSPGVFQFDILFSAVLSKSMFISVLGPSLSLSSSLVILFIHSAFSLFFLVAIFSSKMVWFLWHLVVGMFLCHSLPIVDRIFSRSFGKSRFVCIVLPFVDISLIFLLSPTLSGLFPQVALYFSYVASSFLFPFISAPLFLLSFWLVFVVLLFAFPVEFPIQVFIVSSCSLNGSQFSYKLILYLIRLVYLARLYYSLVFKVVCALFYSFLSLYNVFHFMFLNDGRVVFSLLMILFTFSRFVFYSCDSVLSWLLGSVSFGSAVFSFSEVSSPFRRIVFV